MTRGAVLRGLLAAAAASFVPAAGGATDTAAFSARLVYEKPFGRSAQGRELVVSAFGSPRASRKLAVVGCIHGTECAGTAIARAVLDGCPPTDADLWVVTNLNPDGRSLGTRLNARGVDLNRNFPTAWHPRGHPGDPEYPGPRPFSEPETRAFRRLARRVRPAATIWYHQGQGPMVRAWGGSVPAARAYARRVGYPFRRLRWLAGTAPNWQNRSDPGTSSFVVELADGRLSPGQARRHARAALALARRLERAMPSGQVRGSIQEGR